MSDGAVLDSLSLVGVSHANASVEVREQLSIPNDEAPAFLSELRSRGLASESLVLSTCNRTELYCMSGEPEKIRHLAAMRGARSPDGFETLFYVKRGREAVRHSFAVASGLDSMILGEPEILGQMKKAYRVARDEGFAGPLLARLFERAFSVAKKVRTDTAIARESTSAPAICARLARDIFGGLEGSSVMCVGAGAIVEAALEHFADHRVAGVTVANRTMRHAEELASKRGAKVVPYEDITRELPGHDIVITATSSVLPVIGKGALERACEERRRRPIVIFDLAVPRDVEPEAAKLEDLFLYTIDDIGQLASANLEKRQAAVREAQTHINRATEELAGWFESREADTVIKELRTRVDAIRDREADRVLRMLEQGKDGGEAVRELAHRLANRLANDPIQSLRSGRLGVDVTEEIDNWYREERGD